MPTTKNATIRYQALDRCLRNPGRRYKNYAIWDRRILKYCTGKSSQYGIDKPINYIAYIDKLHEIRTEQNFKDLHQSIQKHFIPLGYEVTAMRAIEIVMFQTSKRKSA